MTATGSRTASQADRASLLSQRIQTHAALEVRLHQDVFCRPATMNADVTTHLSTVCCCSWNVKEPVWSAGRLINAVELIGYHNSQRDTDGMQLAASAETVERDDEMRNPLIVGQHANAGAGVIPDITSHGRSSLQPPV